MMTWLTHRSIFDTLENFDTDLLLTQRLDAGHLLGSLVQVEDEPVPATHPVYRMWDGYHVALAAYAAAVDVQLAASLVNVPLELVGGVLPSVLVRQLRLEGPDPLVLPPWFTDVDVLRSHRSNLVRRWPEYGDLFPGTPVNMPYLFPFVDDDGGYSLNVSKREQAMLRAGERTLPKSIQKKVANL